MAGPISSGIGLVSGLPTDSIIEQLLQLEARPLVQLQQRATVIESQRAAFAELSARLLGLRNAIARFDEPSFFRGAKATSSNENILTATAGEDAAQGTFQFRVRSLVTSHQLISRGFANADAQPVGAGTISFEIGNGRLDHATSLQSLNGGDGVRRGSIEITDRAGNRATVDLSTAITVQDVLDEINSRTELNVRASADGDHIVIEDFNDASDPDLQALVIRDLGGGFAAQDLGIAQQNQDGVVTGTRIHYLTENSRLSRLNDDNGVHVGKNNADIAVTVGDRVFNVGLRGLLQAGRSDQQANRTYLNVLNSGNGVREGTFRITNQAGESAEIEIDDSVQTIGDVIQRINDAGIDIMASVDAGVGRINISDDSTPPSGQTPGNLVIEDVTGFAATDLGLVVDTDEDDFFGNVIYRIETLGDVIRTINHAQDQNFQLNDVFTTDLSDSGDGLSIASAQAFTVGAAGTAIDSTAAEDLGLLGESSGGLFESRPIVAGLNTRLLRTLNGGSGVGTGVVAFVAADGSEDIIDFTGVTSVQGVIDRVNAHTDTTGISARLNAAGNGIDFVDETNGSGATVLKDLGAGTMIRDLFGLDDQVGARVESTDGEIGTGNLQLQYISKSTKLSSLRNGRGVSTGGFRITATNGQSATVNITSNQKTIGDVIAQINAVPLSGVEARINANGDGIEIIDTTGGGGTLTVASTDGSSTAADLNILGNGESGEDESGQPVTVLDGSFEFHVDIDADDTLNDVRSKINDLDAGIRANLINDGSDESPFHLIFNSEVSGTSGRLNIDTGGIDLGLSTLVRAQDAIVFFGEESPFVLTSSTNTLTDVIENVSIDLVGASDNPVELSIAPNLEGLVNNISAFVSSYNEVLTRIDEFTRFDPESFQRGPLFGDSVVTTIQSRLRSVITANVPSQDPGFQRLTSLGIRTGSGGRLTFDEDLFREKFAEDPEAVETLFTTDDTGVGHLLDGTLDDITRSFDGLIASRDALLEDRQELLNDRAVSLQELISRKRTRLERQFAALESNLANLQGAQNSLAALAALAAGG